MITFENGEFIAPATVPYAKELQTAGWYPRMGVWYTTELDNVVPFIEHLDDEILEVLKQTADALDESLARDTDYVIDLPPGRELMGFQKVDVEYIVKRKDTLLAEDCGTGKTAIMIAVLNMLRSRNALIICPAVAKYNWLLNEWPKWTILTERTIDVAEGDNFPDTDIVIINFDILSRHKKLLQAKKWDCLIVDESHRVNNNDARRTVMILGGNLKLKADKKTGRTKEQIGESYCATQVSEYVFDIPPIEAKKRIFATGTPMNRPKNLWTVIRAFDRDGLGADEDRFHRRYCQRYVNHMGVYDDNGAANQQELGAYLRSRFMVRHTDAIDLPPQYPRLFLLPPVEIVISQEKEFIQENLESLIKLGRYMGKTVSEETSPEEFMRIIGEAVIENVKIIGDPVMQVVFTQFAKVREATGLAKVPHIIDYVKLKSDDGAIPVVVYGYHKKVMAALHEAFNDWSFVVGGMTAKRRAEEVRRFQEGETPGFLGNYDAAGESITLTRSNYLIAAELDWRGTQTLQVFKRIKRFTQTRKSYADILCSAKSFDALMAERCLEKIRNIELTLDM